MISIQLLDRLVETLLSRCNSPLTDENVKKVRKSYSENSYKTIHFDTMQNGSLTLSWIQVN